MMVGNLATWMGLGDRSVGRSLYSRESPLGVVEKASVIFPPVDGKLTTSQVSPAQTGGWGRGGEGTGE